MPTGSYQSLSEAPASFELKEVKHTGVEGTTKEVEDTKYFEVQEPSQVIEETSKSDKTDLLHWSLLAQVQHFGHSTELVLTI